jgi:hypothetical protein
MSITRNQGAQAGMKIFSISKLLIIIYSLDAMNKLRICYCLVIIPSLGFLSCYKKIPCDCPLPVNSRGGDLIAFTWQLQFAMSIDSLSYGTLHRYNGRPSDSLHVLWTLNPNIDIYAVCSFIQNNGDSTIANIISISSAAGVPIYDTSTIAYDTIITTTPWRLNYSDTLLITKVSPTWLVFKVGYSDSAGSGVEIDSFRNVGLYRPF